MKKILATLLGLLILLQLFAGCEVPVPEPSEGTINSENDATPSDGTANSGVKLSNVTFYDYANDWVGEAFLNENRVYHALYPAENPEYEGQLLLELNAPRTRTFIFTEEEDFRNICSGATIDVDFEKEMVILYISATDYPSKHKRHYLEEATLCEGVLNVKIKPEPVPEGFFDAGSSPWARCFALKMEKKEITEVMFDGIVMWYFAEGGLIG